MSLRINNKWKKIEGRLKPNIKYKVKMPFNKKIYLYDENFLIFNERNIISKCMGRDPNKQAIRSLTLSHLN